MSSTGPGAPRVSIIIPTYNGVHLLGPTIESVLNQDLVEWELIVADDGSTDETPELAETFASADPRIRVLRMPNRGVAAARNRGFAETDPRSEFVIFLDHDDLWLPDTLSTLVAALDGDPTLVSAYGLAHCIGPDGRGLEGDDMVDRMRERFELRGRRLVPITPQEPTTFAGMIHHNYPVTPGLHLVRRPVMARVGAFDAEAVPADDWDMNLRITREGPIGFVDQVVIEWRRHPEAQSAQSSSWRKAHYRVRANTYSAADGTRGQRRLGRAGYGLIIRSSVDQAWSGVRSDPLRAPRNLAYAGYVTLELVRALAVRSADPVRRRRSGGRSR